MRVKHKPLTNQTDHLKTYLFFSNPLTLISIILLVTMIGCKCNKDNNDDNNENESGAYDGKHAEPSIQLSASVTGAQ